MRLTYRSTLASAVLCLALGSLVRADDAPAAPAPAPSTSGAPAAGGPGHRKHPATELEDRMDEMGAAFKKLRRQITDATQNASSLELVAKLSAGAEKAAKLTPAKASDLPEAERPKFIADYQSEMKVLQEQLAKLSAALKANNNADAEKVLKDIGAMQRKDHKTFQRPQS